MSKTLTNDFKAEFALLLVIMKVNYGTTNSLNYSKTLYEWALAGLVTEGKIKIEWKDEVPVQSKPLHRKKMVIVDTDPEHEIAAAFNACFDKYTEALEYLKIPATGRKEYIQYNIMKACFDIDTAIFPIALSEGILDLKDSVNKALAGMGSMAAGQENIND